MNFIINAYPLEKNGAPAGMALEEKDVIAFLKADLGENVNYESKIFALEQGIYNRNKRILIEERIRPCLFSEITEKLFNFHTLFVSYRNR